MPKQVTNGAGFEYACAASLLNHYLNQGLTLEIDSKSLDSYKTKEKHFLDVSQDTQASQKTVAATLSKYILKPRSSMFKQFQKEGVRYMLRVGDRARDCDVRDLVIYDDGNALGISLKWNSDEIKGARMGPGWFKKFNLEDNGLWENQLRLLNDKLCNYATWKDAIEELGDQAIYGAYRDATMNVLSQNISDPVFLKTFIDFNFGKQDYLKVMAMRQGKSIKIGWYNRKKLPSEVVRIKRSKKGCRYFNVLFDNWLLLFRFHNGDTKIKPENVGSGMKISVTVESWAGKEPEVVNVD